MTLSNNTLTITTITMMAFCTMTQHNSKRATVTLMTLSIAIKREQLASGAKLNETQNIQHSA
jgi:hypothetical protein